MQTDCNTPFPLSDERIEDPFAEVNWELFSDLSIYVCVY